MENNIAFVVHSTNKQELVNEEEPTNEQIDIDDWSIERLQQYVTEKRLKSPASSVVFVKNEKRRNYKAIYKTFKLTSNREDLKKMVNFYIDEEKSNKSKMEQNKPYIEIKKQASLGLYEGECASKWSLKKLRDYLKINEPSFVGRTTADKETLVKIVNYYMKKTLAGNNDASALLS
ncbi:HESP112 [Hemileuca sp. nucleopolyhedrovirus]|uniref:HESP112 n=1 Tax=Hemileuca sp. nucleopolyhedrovirus TaxID=1367203 RepID=S5MQI5_9ABAC|nr:HESP112 [Hemileuca sp. nucleopolyhedrovirus]AGR56864.1 HESP112 [Hemileuca sp. nucleopolyhedrovirus]